MEAESHLSEEVEARLDRILEENPTVDMLKELPSEMQMYVAVQMRYPDVVRFCATSTEAKRVCSADYFWKLKSKHDFPDEPVGPEGKRRETYKKYWEEAQAKLVECAEHGHIKCIESSLQLGIDPNIGYNKRWTALIVASSKGYIDMVRLLLKYDANTNIQDDRGGTALIEASRWGHADIIALLLKYDANTNIQNKRGQTALIEASIGGHADIIRVLLDHDADPDIPNREGWTAIRMAARYGYVDMVRLLLNSGADSQDALYFGLRHAGYQGSWHRHPDIVALLSDRS